MARLSFKFLHASPPGLVIFLLLLPVQWLRYTLNLAWRRCRSDRELPWKDDLSRSTARSLGALLLFLPLCVPRRVGLIKPETLRGSARFGHIGDRLFNYQKTAQFSAVWICQSPFSPSPSMSMRRIVLLYIHGGAYRFGHPSTQAIQLLRVAEVLSAEGIDLSVMSLGYSLAPETQLPVQQSEAAAAYRYLVEQLNIPVDDVVIAGESAGGHLALACLLEIAKQGMPKPGGAFLSYPWVNLDNSGDSFLRNQHRDVLHKGMLDECSRLLVDDRVRRDYPELINFATPLKGPWNWKLVLPEHTHVNVGSHDLFLDDIMKFRAYATQAGAKVDLYVADGLTHGWNIHMDQPLQKKYITQKPGSDAHLPGSESMAKAIFSLFNHGSSTDMPNAAESTDNGP